jgi:hypothetical protein
MALFAACSSANSADLFFVVGQVGNVWPGQKAQSGVKLLSWSVGSKFTSVASQACKGNCPDVDPVDGVIPAFAYTWTGLSKSSAHFAIYRKPDVALTLAGADGKGYWTDFETSKGVYQDALSEFRKAQQSAAFTTPDGITRRYLIWVQNESDARAGVSAKDYAAKLIELNDRFNKDLGADGKPFDAMFIVSSGLVRATGTAVAEPNGSTAATATLDKVNAIVQAQDDAAAQGKLVMISRSMRRSVADCTGSPGRSGCASKDLLRYQTWLFETLGAEMARNAFIYHTKNIKPLLPESCKQEPTSCAGTVDVYRWVAKGDTTRKPVYGTDPYEFDEKTYYNSRMRFALFMDAAPGRIPLYRNAVAGGPGLSTEPDSAKVKSLGYCYGAPSGNANAKLVSMRQDGMTAVARQPTDASAVNVPIQEEDKTLCYVN